MPNYVSPGVFVIEKDISQYAPTIDSSVVGVVGFASKGPVNKATLITSPQNLVDTFGLPREDLVGQGLEGSIEILEATNNLYYIRAAGDNAANASASIPMGACPSVEISAGDYGDTSGIWLKVQVTDNNGVSGYSTPKEYSIPAGTGTGGQAAAIQKIVGGSLDSAKLGLYFDTNTSTTGHVVGSWAGSGTSLGVSAYRAATMATNEGLSVLHAMDPGSGDVIAAVAVSSVQAFGSTFLANDLSGIMYQTQSLHPGGGYNVGTKSNGDTSGNSIEIKNLGGPFVNLVVNEDGVAKENFKVSLIASASFVEDIINVGSLQNLTSDTIQGSLFFSGSDAATPVALSSFPSKIQTVGLNVLHGASGSTGSEASMNPRFTKMIAGTVSMAGGVDGVPTGAAAQNTAIIGDAAVNPKTGMQALDDELINISVALIPGITTQAVQNALITLAEATQSFLAVISPPYGIGTVQNAIDWSNGQSDTRTASVDSSYAAVYWPWVQTFSVHDSKDRWFDPAIYAARQIAFNDSIAEPWFAPAGFTRGRLSKPTDVEVKLNQGDRDSMYSGGNVLNPIVNFIRQGITIFGQKTSQRKPSALDRINVRRLLIQVRKVILETSRQFIFEPNDVFTWDLIQQTISPFLDQIRMRRGITEFRVVCDSTVNTPARVDRNELWCKVLIKPTKTAEIIIFEINLTNQSAQLGL